MERYLILIAGMPATGKATFADYLSRKLDISRACKDQVKEILFDQIGFQSAAEKRKLGVTSNHILYYFAEAQMRVGNAIILENLFQDKEKESLLELAGKYGYKIVTILFEGEMEAVYQRFIEREMSPGRHKGHASKVRYPEPDRNVSCPPPVTLEEFREWILSMGISKFSLGETIKVNTTDFSAVDYPELVNQIQNVINGQEEKLMPVQ